jgi:lipoprotein-releasing system permease protein
VEFVFTSENNPLRRDAYKVCGIYSSGMTSMEQGLVLTDLRNIQRINGWAEREVSAYKIMALDLDSMVALCDMVRAEAYLSSGGQMWRTLHLGEKYPQIFDWLATHDINGMVVIVIMLVVALLNMISALLIIIFERISMIGTLKSLGMRNRGVQRVFLRCGLKVILEGLLWGNLIGGVLLLTQHLTGFVGLDPEAYIISEVPVAFDLGWWLGLNVAIPVVLILLMMIPVAITSRIKPTQTLKYQ